MTFDSWRSIWCHVRCLRSAIHYSCKWPCSLFGALHALHFATPPNISAISHTGGTLRSGGLLRASLKPFQLCIDTRRILSATSFVPCFAVCAHWFKRRLAFAIGFTGAVSSLGGIIYPTMINRRILCIGFGVHPSFLVSGFI
jgi:hypothetical protein